MSVFQKLADKLKPKPTDVNGIDFDMSATKVVRVRKVGEELTLAGVDILAPVDCSLSDFTPPTFSIPSKIRANYAAISLNVHGTALKLLTTPGAVDDAFDQKLARNLGLPDDTLDRLGYRILVEGSGRAESRILAVGIPEPDATNCLSLFATGMPAPWHFEASPVAALTAFEAGPVATGSSNTIGFLEFSSRACCFSIFHKKSLMLIRRFDFGMEKVFNKITTSLNVDHATASNILSDEAFDVSDLLHDILQPLFSQLVVSRDFIERRDNCSLQGLYISGSFSTSDTALELIEKALNITVTPWDPFDIPNLSIPTALPAEYDSNRWQFGAALGAALGTFEEEA